MSEMRRLEDEGLCALMQSSAVRAWGSGPLEALDGEKS